VTAGRAPGDRPAIVTTVVELRTGLDAARAAGRTVGLVPTMGAFHEGHLSLMRRARAEHDLVVVTLFVNPLQFAPTEDLATYPRDLDRDRAMAAAEGVDVIFHPAVEEMYPTWPPATTVRVSGPSEGLESVTRPHFFEGVATVVAKLFGIAGACTAYFGRKDFQQLAVVRRMADDLRLPVTVVGCPIVREPDGLAMSSRNVHLSERDRHAARSLSRGLAAGVAVALAGERDPQRVRAAVAGVIEAEPAADLDYAAVVDADTLRPLDELTGTVLLAVAARVGTPRLIDNCTVTVRPDGTATTDLQLPSAHFE
jgi:pantoate--beta-alanine ligase